MNQFRFDSPRVVLAGKIVLGNPAKDCEHLGICHVHQDDDDEPGKPVFRLRCPSFKVELSILPFGQLEIFIPSGNISDELRERHFSTNVFFIITPFYFPPAIAARLGYPGVCPVIRPGIYPWVETPDGIYLRFSLIRELIPLN